MIHVQDVLARLREVQENKKGWMACCPAHDDHQPSLSLRAGRDGSAMLHCFAGCDRDAVLCALGLDPSDRSDNRRFKRGRSAPPQPSRLPAPPGGEQDPGAQARALWTAALARAQDDSAVEKEKDLWDYLDRRHLLESWELRAFGALPFGWTGCGVGRRWHIGGYRLIVPLHDLRGQLVSVQGRSIEGAEPKVLVPFGFKANGKLFADRRGREILHKPVSTPGNVLLGEGLTDHLALTIYSSVAVLSVPGTGNANDGIATWVRGRVLIIAFDADNAGREAADVVARTAYDLGAESVRRLVWPARLKDACEALDKLGPYDFGTFLESSLCGVVR